MYGLEANVIQPPLSALISILLVIGCDLIGITFIWKFLKIDTSHVQWIRWQSPIIGVAFVALLIYPLALFGFASRSELRLIALILIASSFIHLYMNFKTFYAGFIKSAENFYLNFDFRSSSISLILVFLILGYALLALAPVTSSDSLDYHIGVPIEILNTGLIFNTPEWFHSRLSGSGEVLNALGLSIGAEQFGSILQFVGLMGVVGLILDVELPEKLGSRRDSELLTILSLLVLSAPLIVFLVSSSKFQLLPVSMTTLAISLIFFPSRRNLTSIDSIKSFFLICILVMVASQMKINYQLSGGLIGLFALLQMYQKKIIWQSSIIILLVAFITIVPVIIIKSQIYSADLIEVILSPLPGDLPGLKDFEASIRNAQETKILFPFSFILPSSIGTITTIIGFGALIVLFFRPENDKWLILLIIFLIFVFILILVLGPRSSRSYLEPYFWSLIAVSLQNENRLFFKFRKIIKPLVIIQSLFVILICWYGVINLSPGGFSSFSRDTVMSKSANGYELMKWVDEILPAESVILSSHRSMALVPRKSVSLDWLNYFKPDADDISQFINLIDKKNVTHILLYKSQINANTPHYKIFYNCINDKKFSTVYEKQFTNVTRNPFNSGFIDSFIIFKLNQDKFVECLRSRIYEENPIF